LGIFLPSFKLTVEFNGITVAWINQHKPLRSYFLHMINAPLKVALSGHATAAYEFLSGGGETGELIRSFDWESSSLGPVEGWSQGLKTCIRILLTSPHPMFLWWGNEAVYIYNDAVIPLLKDLHPGSLGYPAAQGWGDLWEQLEPQFSSLMESGMLAANRPLLQVMVGPDLSYHFNGTLIPGDSGDMAGVMAVGVAANGAVIYRHYQEFLPEMKSAMALPKNKLQQDVDPAAIYTLAAIVENSDDAIVSKTLDGVVTSWNPAAEKLFGFTAAEMIGALITRIIPADRMEEEPRIIAKLRAGERVDHFETKRLTKSGELLDISLTISPIKDIQGNIVGASKIARDITSQRRLFSALEESEAKYMQLALKLEALVEQRTRELLDANFYLEKSNRELEQFAYVTSHDLQEPLRKIHTFAGMLYNVNKEILSETSCMYIDKVMFSARRMSQLINELLDYSRLVHVKDPFVETDLNEILKNVLIDYEVTIGRHEVQLELGELPRLLVSPLQMNQLFHNLLGNALKFLSPTRKPLIKIYTQQLPMDEKAALQELDPEKEYYKITIKDNGIGFEQTYASKIFQIFQRLNERTAFEGTGIGLALCSKIVQNHKGAIYANGVPDEGAEFNVILPVSA